MQRQNCALSGINTDQVLLIPVRASLGRQPSLAGVTHQNCLWINREHFSLEESFKLNASVLDGVGLLRRIGTLNLLSRLRPTLWPSALDRLLAIPLSFPFLHRGAIFCSPAFLSA